VAINSRPCGSCLHLDSRQKPDGMAWCWAFYMWQSPADVVADCTESKRANGQPPPFQIRYPGESS
jgi:hypothetical protein